MVTIKELMQYLDRLLEPQRFQDSCPNGLQVEGRSSIQTIISGVTASQLLLDYAVKMGAQAVLVHHGYFWVKESPVLTGIKYQRIRTLMNHSINLIVYHLPLDYHLVYGNNIRLAQVLNIQIDSSMYLSPNIFNGQFDPPLAPNDLIRRIETVLHHTPLYIQGHSENIRTIAWCSGAAQRLIDEALRLGVDAYLTGEASEQTVHIARESGLHFFAAGHHATERYGVQSLGEHLAQVFGLTHHFVDIDNPV